MVAAVPHGNLRTTTFVAGLRRTGVVAPLVLDGPMTGTAFRAAAVVAAQEEELEVRAAARP